MTVVKVFYCSVSNTRQVWIRKSLFVKTKGRYHRCRLIVCHGSKLDVAGEQLGNAVLDLVLSDELGGAEVKSLDLLCALRQVGPVQHGGLLRDGSSHQGGDALRNGSADGLRVVKTGFYTPDLSHQFDHFHFSAFCLQHMRKQGDEHTKSHEQKTKSDSKRNHAMLQSTLLFR